MAQSIRLRRGTKVQLDAITLLQGEIGYTTDTDEVYVGDGSATHLVGKVYIDLNANRPVAGVAGRLFHASDTGKLYLDTGVAWVMAGPTELADMDGDLDDIADGTTYGRILNTQITSGQVNQLDDGANNVTAAQARTHIDDADQHRLINDSASGTTDLWSANKIANTINNTTSGISWQEPVQTLNLISDADQGAAPPAAPVRGDSYVANNWGGGYTDDHLYEWNGSAWSDLGLLTSGMRFIISAVSVTSAAGSFVGQDNDFAEWDGATWTFVSPVDGFACLATNDNSLYENDGYTYSGASAGWVQFTGAGQINAGTALTKDGNTLNVGLGAGVAELPGDEVGLDLSADTGLALTSLLTAGKLTLQNDGSTIDVNGSNQIYVPASGIGEVQITSAAIAEGLTGGSGTTLSVEPDSTSGAAVAPVSSTANGTGTKVDNASVVHTAGVLAVATVDGGSF